MLNKEGVSWQFTTTDAIIKLKHLYPRNKVLKVTRYYAANIARIATAMGSVSSYPLKKFSGFPSLSVCAVLGNKSYTAHKSSSAQPTSVCRQTCFPSAKVTEIPKFS